MKEFWSILMGKLKLVEPNFAAIGMGLLMIITLALTSTVINSFFDMISEIIRAFAVSPVAIG